MFSKRRRSAFNLRLLGLAFTGLTAALVPVAAASEAEFELVPEMEAPPGIEALSRHQRSALQDWPEAQAGLAALEDAVRVRWSEIREVDLVELSRYHVELTHDWRLPSRPGQLTGQILAGSADDRVWFLELRGPRLPARFDIVHRYLTIFARYDAASGELDRLTVTIRGWVLE